MKFQLLIPTTFLALSANVAANNCKINLNYCGWDLLNTGNYHDTIVAELRRVGMPVDNNHIYNDLYHCKDQEGGIYFVKSCRGENTCIYGGENRDDWC